MKIKKAMQRKIEEYISAPHKRSFSIKSDHIDEDARTVKLAFSSEEPYQRWFGMEILGHKKDEVDLSRMKDAPLLVGHNHDDLVGVVEDVSIDGDSKGRAVVRFGKSDRASEIFQDIKDGIRRQISVGYSVLEMKLMKEIEEGVDEYRVTQWQPFEVSTVSVAADASVGIGRSKIEPVEESTEIKKVIKMDEVKKVVEKAPVVDVNAERETARAQERARINELMEAGNSYDAVELAQAEIKSGGTIDELNRAILKRNGSAVMKAEKPEIGLSEKEKGQFSIVRALDALANPQDRKAQEAAAFEFECSQAACAVLKKDSKGIMIPMDVLQRDLNVGTAGDGGNLVGTDILSGSFIDKLENMMAVREAGATVLGGLNGNIAIPRRTGGSSSFWLAENGAPSESSATFDQVSMTPKSVGAYTEISRKLLKQSSISIEQFIQGELAQTLALAIDAAAINGSGASNQPTGILNTAGIGSVAGGTNGLAPTWGHVVDLESAVANVNAADGALAYLTNTKVRGKLKQTDKASGAAQFVWNGDANPLNGSRSFVSNQVPSNLVKGSSGAVCSAIVYGNFADLLIAMWGGLDLLVDPYSLSTTSAVRVTAFQDIDINVRHAESFAAMVDALT